MDLSCDERMLANDLSSVIIGRFTFGQAYRLPGAGESSSEVFSQWSLEPESNRVNGLVGVQYSQTRIQISAEFYSLHAQERT